MLSCNRRTLQRWQSGEWYPSTLALAKLHNLEQELKREYDVENDPTATKSRRHSEATGDAKIEQKSMSPPSGSPSSGREVGNKERKTDGDVKKNKRGRGSVSKTLTINNL